MKNNLTELENRIKKFWEGIGTKYYDNWHMLEQESYHEVAIQIAKDMNPGDKILEIACGTGILTQEIESMIFMPHEYIASDYSEEMVNICHQTHPRTDTIIVDAAKLPFPNSTFDKVIVTNALHIMPNSQLVLSEISRVLKDNGNLYAPNFLTPKTKKEKTILCITKLLGYQIFNPFDIDSYVLFLNQNGFEVTKRELYICFREMLYVSCTKKTNDLEKFNHFALLKEK